MARLTQSLTPAAASQWEHAKMTSTNRGEGLAKSWLKTERLREFITDVGEAGHNQKIWLTSFVHGPAAKEAEKEGGATFSHEAEAASAERVGLLIWY